ncbi:MAG: Eco57I restriction-modification methylase domain-containing protein [Bacteroidales bacterium]|nr:Eco57I restriction-modification methylase domain-containing protein [Bacteroidales bacterium]
MPDNNLIRTRIKDAIKRFTSGNLTENALNLFKVLGYNKERQAPLQEKTFEEFKDDFIEAQEFNEDKALVNDWRYVDLLFQLTKEEIAKQSSLFDTRQVDNTIIETYLFFTIDLTENSYTRTALSNITREINKLFPMPVMILFKHGDTLTLSVINRRLHKRDQTKDVLEKVTQIKDIKTDNPHRAHIEILFDLSFEELKRKHNFTNFVELHNAWQKTLDIKELNKQFYQKLFNWYLWTLKEVKFPQTRPEKDLLDNKVHQSESLIRLLTRMLFVWFMKEKGLINHELFNQNHLVSILKDFEGKKGENTIFYKAILQNLFFATLNKPIVKRKIIDKGFNPKEYGDPLVYRFDELFKHPEKLLDYFRNIPFLNGGLFECLDQPKSNENPEEIRLDGFSTKKSKQVHLPDKYFFGEHTGIDLSEDYDDKKKKNVTVFGLIDILDQYKFTVEESTPVDEEIALDPELLGKVFENLLASYNPETKTTARKKTGSFYTPREIVNYMVDESLIAYLKNTVDDEERLRKLFSYSHKEEENPFNQQESKQLVAAIDECKIIDPACGSGAFPMGALQKLTHILHKLDPENKIWFDMVINNLPHYMQPEARKKLQKENWNYIRKLGIIQQCIYGVDIQPIAIQIAKLRFFIALLVDQQAKPDEHNLGYEPLPNLDFKLVAANTLISAPQNEAIEAYAKDALDSFEKLTDEYFSAINERKAEIKDEIKKNTNKIVNANRVVINQWLDKIRRESNSVSAAKQKKMQQQMVTFQRDLERWNTFRNIYKNESVAFFEIKYFFPQIKEGFDIVFGNPPYGAKVNAVDKPYFQRMYTSAKTIAGVQKGSLDTYTLFIELGHSLCKSNANLHYIVPISITSSDSATGVHKLLEDTCSLIKISSYAVRPEPVFENAVVNTSIIFFKKDNISVQSILSTKMYRKKGVINLRHLVENLEFIDVSDVKLIGRYPKISLDIEKKILKKILNQKTKIGDCLKTKGNKIYYRTSGGRYFKVITNYSTGSTKERYLVLDENIADSIGAILSSNLYFWFYQIFSNNLDLKTYEIVSFGLPLDKLSENINEKLVEIYSKYLKDIEKNANVRQTTKYKNIESFKEYKIGKSKPIIDQIDDIIGQLYGLNKTEVDFIKNYEVQFRLQYEE